MDRDREGVAAALAVVPMLYLAWFLSWFGTAGDSEHAADVSFAVRRVPPATAEERLVQEAGIAPALTVGAAPYRDAEGQARYVDFQEAGGSCCSFVGARHGKNTGVTTLPFSRRLRA